MKYFFHDASRILVSLCGIAFNTLHCGKKKINESINHYLNSNGFVSRDEFEAFSKIAQSISLKQSDLEKKISELKIND